MKMAASSSQNSTISGACMLKSSLLNCQMLSEMAIGEIRGLLLMKTVKELSTLAKSLGVRLAGSTRKADIVE